MKADAKVGLFVFLVLVISVFFLVAHELSQRGPKPEDETGGEAALADEPGATSSVEITTGKDYKATGGLPISDPAAAKPVAKADGPVSKGVSASPVVDPAMPRFEPLPPASAASEYTVASGDSLWTISKKVYGSGAKWKQIFEANRDRIRSPEANLKVGMKLSIPEMAPSGMSAGRASAPRDFGIIAPAPGEGLGGARTHTVSSGDSLWTISKRVYGSGAKWQRIYEANRDRIASPESNLKVGMKLVIPEATASVESGPSSTDLVPVDAFPTH